MKLKLRYPLLAIILIVALAIAFPVGAMADDDPGVAVSKVATVQEDGTYVLDLEAFATGTVTTTTVVKPCDLVLVLDASSSMGMSGNNMEDGTRRIQALVNAVNAFLKTVADKNAENADAGSDLSKVAIVVFSDSSHTGTLYDFTEITQANLNSNSVYATYSGATYSTSPYGTSGKGFALHNYTWTDSGLSQANTLLTNLKNSNGYNMEERNRVVVLFTDGYPNHGGGASDFDAGAAADVVTNARAIKLNHSALLYTIAVLGDNAMPGVNPVGANNNSYNTTSEAVRYVNQMLHAASSNFPQAQATGSGTGSQNNRIDMTFNFGTGDYTAGYYKSAKRASDLESIFTEIAENSASTKTPLTSESIMKDIVSSSFTLPAGASADTIEVKVVPWDSTSHAWSTTGGYSIEQWKTQCTNYGAEAQENIEIELKDNGKTVDVKGFDYGTHFLATSDPTQDINDINKNSAKLVIRFPILAKPSAVTGGKETTNGPESGIYLDGNATEPLVKFPVPEVVFTPITYVVDYVNSDTSVDTKASSIVLDYASVLKNVEMLDNPSDDVLRGEAVGDFTYTIYKGRYGTISYGDDENDVQRRYVRYAPTTMNWDDYDRIFIKGESASDSNLDVWAMLAVVPANSVYYEDTYITQTKTVTYNGQQVTIEYTGINYTGSWNGAGTEGGNTTQHANTTMGWIDGLADDTTYGNGYAHYANTAKAKATFTVSGTGIDIYSRTNGSTGTVTINAKSLAADNESGKKITKTKLIDTKAAAGDYYEIPVCSFTDLPYGKYTVTITVTTGGQAEGRMTFYLDGVRVYNPMKPHEDEGLVQELYGPENLGAVFTEVRSLLGSDATASALYIDEHTVSEIVTDLDAIEEAANALAEAQQDREDYVEAYISPKQAVLNQAKVDLETAQRNLDRATEAYNDAEAELGALQPGDEGYDELNAAVEAAAAKKAEAQTALEDAQAAVAAAQAEVDDAIAGKAPYDEAVEAAVNHYDEVNDGIEVRYTTEDVAEYNKEGPKTEVLLSSGQQVAINVEAGKTYYIGLRSLYGDNVSASINGSAVDLVHTADLYYEATPSGGTIVIKNIDTDESVLSITKLRTTGVGNTTSGAKLASTEETLAYVRSLSALPVSGYAGEVLTAEEAAAEPVAEEPIAEEPAAEPEEAVEVLDESDIVIENPEPTETENAAEDEPEPAPEESAMEKVLASFFDFFRRRH